ncbi:hypothetical protein CJG67_003942 [Salmonella enterica subsp. enterica serovar Gaminara]|nr:hypothetical protein [Salmonella enterica subsp. enterica serovar Gaminara]
MIIILDEQYNEVEIIPTCFSDAEAIAAAKKAVHEAALAGKTFTVVNEDGEFLFRAVSISEKIPTLNLKVTGVTSPVTTLPPSPAVTPFKQRHDQ